MDKGNRQLKALIRRRGNLCFTLSVFCLALLVTPASLSQLKAPATAPAETKAENPSDTLGRDTPRGTVLGFLSAARKDNAETAALYLNTPMRGANAEDLARQLAVVLDRRLPPRLNVLSDKPEGSLPDKISPDDDYVGLLTVTWTFWSNASIAERLDVSGCFPGKP